MDHLEQGLHGAATFGRVVCRVAVAGTGEDVGEVECLVVCAQFGHQVECFGEYVLGSAVGPVDLVDDHQWPQLLRQCFLQDEASLRPGSFEGVDEQQCAIGHLQHAFDFASKVSVPGSVDDIDRGVAVGQRDVLGEDRDASFSFEVIRVEDQVAGELIVSKLATLAQQAVDQAGLAVVDMGDDGDVAEVGSKHAECGPMCRWGVLGRGDYGERSR